MIIKMLGLRVKGYRLQYPPQTNLKLKSNQVNDIETYVFDNSDFVVNFFEQNGISYYSLIIVIYIRFLKTKTLIK